MRRADLRQAANYRLPFSAVLLTWAGDTGDTAGGRIVKRRLITPHAIALLAALASPALAAELPPTCPAGAHAVGDTPPKGFEWRCENAAGAPEGPWLNWYGDGQRMSERHMKNGREHGRQRSWWPNGQLMMEGVSVDGNRYQGFKYWGIDGSPAHFETKTEPLKIDNGAGLKGH
jgi:hypothetical protein